MSRFEEDDNKTRDKRERLHSEQRGKRRLEIHLVLSPNVTLMLPVAAARVQNIDRLYPTSPRLITWAHRDAEVGLIFRVYTGVLLSLQCGPDCLINSTSRAQRSIEVNLRKPSAASWLQHRKRKPSADAWMRPGAARSSADTLRNEETWEKTCVQQRLGSFLKLRLLHLLSWTNYMYKLRGLLDFSVTFDKSVTWKVSLLPVFS